ncbi:MAG: hypothetical protein FGM33_02380 [Candidatus Kapabacteria bacterium]|nr:hypothetical protein [Candidatus Kapabacteria bacterium]
MLKTALSAFCFTIVVFLSVTHRTKAQDLGDSSKSIKLQIFGQFWARYNESNPFTMQQGAPVDNTFDIGIRRARVQAFCTVNERTTLFLHYGFNNMNTNFASSGNRKIQAFFHDVFAEYRAFDHNELKLGAGLAFVNGLSRYSQPAVIAMPTADIPVFGQATVEQIDIFGRKLSLTARGQIGPIDYRVALSDPFPITTNGNPQLPLGSSANFAQVGHSLQQQAYVIYQFRDHEPHQVSNMAGTYYGQRNVFNIAAGIMHQPRAMWRAVGGDTVYEAMTLMAVESMYDAPINSNGTTISAYAGLFSNNYGRNYLRYNGVMNPGTASQTGLDSTQIKPLASFGPSFGNAFPMFGTGTVIYSHLGVYFPRVLGQNGLMPYVSTTQAWYQRLEGRRTDIYHVGCSLLLDGLRSRLTLDVQNRPTYGLSMLESPFGELVEGMRRTQVVMQYQVVW